MAIEEVPEKGVPKLFDPIKINEVEIKNRIAMAPMGVGGLVTEDGCFSKRAEDYYVERAKGGVGLIVSSVTKVENEIEEFKRGLFPIISLNPARFVETAGEMTEKVHAHGTKIFLQLALGFGRVASPHILETEPVAPSAVPNFWDPSVTCRELTTKEVETLIKKAVEAAEVASEAGFDGVEIHAIHEGYLLDQFAISMFNKRTDKYGGQLKDRLRFGTEVVQQIKQKMGEEFPVQLRYSVKSYIKDWGQGGLPNEDFEEKGRDVEEGIKAAQILEKAGYDAFSADAGSYDAWYWAHPPVYQEYGCYLPLTERLKEAVDLPIIVAGRMDSPEVAQETIRAGKEADMVAIGRGLLSDAYWPKKMLENRIEDIRPCIACHQGCLGRIFAGRPLSCAVNPACGREVEYDIPLASEKKKVAIIGGGVSGLEAARVTGRKGHEVTVYEKSNNLGGHVVEAGSMEFKEPEQYLLKWYKTQLDKLGVKINLNKEVSLDFNYDEFDEVIIATGSNYIKTDIPGVENNKVMNATDALLNKEEVGNSVIIIGGGLVGCETALWLYRQDKKVVIVEKEEQLMKSGLVIPYANKKMLLELLAESSVEILNNKSLFEVVDEGAVIIDNNFKRETIPADNIILAVGLAPDKELYRSLKGKISNLHLIGDARDPRNIMGAIWDAYEVARHL
jgi:2-enoate reductase